MIDVRTAPYAATLLRVSLGLMYIAHSLVLKHFMYTLPGTAQFFASLGLPAALAYATFWAELLGGVLLVAGVVLGIAAYTQSHGTTNPLAQRDAIVLALTGVSVSVVGLALFLRYSLGALLRLWLARLVLDKER